MTCCSSNKQQQQQQFLQEGQENEEVQNRLLQQLQGQWQEQQQVEREGCVRNRVNHGFWKLK
jgi:hypothetical protein